jgi:uncharacterized protein involved in oxidation of intracellular sulfur
MKTGVVSGSANPETVWNGFRSGVFALRQGDDVNVFLPVRGVECERLDTDQFKVAERMRALLEGGGRILACGSCLRLRHSDGIELCLFPTMKGLCDIAGDQTESSRSEREKTGRAKARLRHLAEEAPPL